MGHVITFLAKLEAAIQRRFDSVCFFLMRRFGVRKSHIRYVLYALIIGAYGAQLAVRTSFGLTSPIGVFIGGVFILILLLGQHFEARSDRDAEASPGVASGADKSGNTDGILKSIVYVLAVLDGLEFKYPPSEFTKAGLTDGQHFFPTLCSLVFWISYLAYLYLRKTPLNPPAERQMETILSPQPAPAKL